MLYLLYVQLLKLLMFKLQQPSAAVHDVLHLYQAY